jgi:hypothetical protein
MGHVLITFGKTHPIVSEIGIEKQEQNSDFIIMVLFLEERTRMDMWREHQYVFLVVRN